MKIHKLTIERLKQLPKDMIPIEFMSNIKEGNKEIGKLLPEINLIDSKIGKLCSDVFERMSK
jgi:hypothetical protein